MQDIRHAMRALRRLPGFSALAVLTLSLAIAATTTIFGVVDAVIVRPLPFAAPEGLIQIRETAPSGAEFPASEPDFLDFAAQNRSLAALAAYRPADVTLTGSGDPLRLHAVAASQSLFSVLGVRPAMGRGFLQEEDAPDAPTNVVVLSHALWSARFGGDSTVIGQTVELDGRPHTVVGVMPAGYQFPAADAFVPLHASVGSDRTDHWLDLVGRMQPGVSVSGAQRDLVRVAGDLGAVHPMSKGWGARAFPLSRALVDDNFRRAGWVLLAATGLLLLLACANVANLLLARGFAREGELGVRAAIGAGRWRLVRQLLTESGVLVVLAAAVGLLGTLWGIEGVRAVGAGRIPRLGEVAADGRVVVAALVLAAVTSVACGLAPALRATRVDPARALAQGARAGISRRHRRVRDVLVVVQVALSMVLLAGAGLMIRSFARLATAGTGFDAAHVLAVNVALPSHRYGEARRSAFFERLAERLSAVPGVRAVGATSVDPFSGFSLMNDVTPEDRVATTPPTGYMQAGWRSVAPGFFDAMRIPIVRGRVFSAADASNGPSVAVVSRMLANALWPGENVVGKRLYWGGTDGEPRTIVGVVGDIRDVAPERASMPMLFVPASQVPMAAMTFVVRSAGEPTALAGAVRDAIQRMDPMLPVADVHPLARNRVNAMAAPRFHVLLMASFAVLALVLATSGLSAVIAFNVTRRRREIGIRLAIGAERRSVVAGFVRSGLVLTGIGMAAGLVVFWMLSRFMRGLLYGVAPNDPVTFWVVALVLGTAALLASYLAARRAAEVSPTEALRME